MSLKKSSSKLPSTQLLLVALLVNLGGSFHFGYQLTITNPCQDSFIYFLDESFHSHFGWHLIKAQLEAAWSFIVAVLFLGAIIGSLSLRQIAEKIGRKKGLILAYTLSAGSVTLSMFAYFIGSLELYACSRLTLGFSLGLSLGLDAVYLTECSPKNCRGIVSMTLGVMVQLGTVVGSIIAMPQMLCTSSGWWRIYGFEAVILLVVLAVLPFVHESPGFLVLQGDDQAARQSIQFFYNSSTSAEVENSLEEIKENVQVSKKSVGMLQLKSFDRKGTLAGCTVAFAMAFSGIAVINAFAVEIFRSTGLSLFDASVANVGLSVISLLSCIVSSFIIERFGRRYLLLLTVTSILFVNLTIFALMLAYQNYGYDWLGVCLIAAISIFIFAFATGPGPLCFFITSEMVSQNARSAGQSWATLVQMTSRTILLTVFLPLKNVLGSAQSYLLLFVAPIFFSIIFFYFGLPETKNRNSHEIKEEFNKLPKVTDFIGKYCRKSQSSVSKN